MTDSALLALADEVENLCEPRPDLDKKVSELLGLPLHHYTSRVDNLPILARRLRALAAMEKE